LDFYECRHGLGYTKIHSKFAGIESRTLYFVPLGENLEIWELTLTNHRQVDADLSVFSAVEFCLWDAYDDATNFQRNYSIAEVEVEGGVIYHKSGIPRTQKPFCLLHLFGAPGGVRHTAQRLFSVRIAAGNHPKW